MKLKNKKNGNNQDEAAKIGKDVDVVNPDVQTEDKEESEVKEEAEIKVEVDNPKASIDINNAAAIYSLWFGLDYGSILTAYALYKTVETLGKKSYLIEKPKELWSDHYADKDNISGKFIYKNCNVIESFSDENDKKSFDAIDTHIVGSDILWDETVVGAQAGKFFYLDEVNEDSKLRISYGTSIGSDHDISIDKRYDYWVLLHKFDAVSVKSFDESLKLADMYDIQSEIVLDPVFLCDKSTYEKCAGSSVANEIEKEDSFIFTYIKNGDERKKDLVLRGNRILMEKYVAPFRNFIDINRFPESQAAIGLEPAYHILVDDWLHYILHSDFVITDDYYGMCFAILFNKNFVVVGSRDMKDVSRYSTLLDQLGLSERMVFVDDDLKTKEYLFRKPIRYNVVNEKLEKLKNDSFEWFRKSVEINK